MRSLPPPNPHSLRTLKLSQAGQVAVPQAFGAAHSALRPSAEPRLEGIQLPLQSPQINACGHGGGEVRSRESESPAAPGCCPWAMNRLAALQ